MSHRTALALSLALTLLLATGVVVGRDRLFISELAASSNGIDAVSPAPASVDNTLPVSVNRVEGEPRVVEIPLPTTRERTTGRERSLREPSRSEKRVSRERERSEDDHEEEGDD